MINVVNQRYIGLSPNTLTNNMQNGTEEGQEVLSKAPKMYIDKLELSEEGIKKSALLKKLEMNLEKPRAWSISIETLDSRISHVKDSIKKADSLNLSFDERLTFLQEEGKKWTEGIKQSDPEMYQEWMKMNRKSVV